MPKVSSNYILKADKPALHQQIDNWLVEQQPNIEALKPELQQWFQSEVASLRETIDQPKAYYWQVNSLTRHIGRSVRRMQSGEIAGLTSLGGFEISK